MIGGERCDTYCPDRHQIDEWSGAIHAELSTWSVSVHGEWTWQEPGSLELVSRSDGVLVFDPISIATAYDQLTLSIDRWHVHLRDMGAADACADAKTFVANWLCGEMVVLSTVDANGQPVAGSSATAENLNQKLAQLARMRRSSRIEVRRSSGEHDLFEVKRRWRWSKPKLVPMRPVR